MAKVYISADLEGVNDVYDIEQLTVLGGLSYQNAIKQQALELNAVIEGLLRAGAEITVNDAHTGFDNISPSILPSSVELTTGNPRPVSMMYGLNKTYDCVYLLGYHCKAGTANATLAHTFNMKFSKVILNGKPIGESELNTIYAGILNIPVAFATGDNLFCEQIKKDIGGVTTVTTKTAVSFNEIIPRDNDKLLTELKQKSYEALINKDNWIHYSINPPYRMHVEFINPENVRLLGYLPLIKQVSEFAVEFSSEDYSELYKIFQFISAVTK